MRRSLVPRVVGIAITVASVALLAGTMDLSTAAIVLGRASMATLAVALVVLALELCLRAQRWSLLLLIPSGQARPPFWRIVPPLAIGYLGNTLLPSRLGEPIRAIALAQREGLDPSSTFGAVIVERLIDTITLAAVGAAAAALVGGPAWLFSGTLFVLAGSALVGVFILAIAVVRGRARRSHEGDGATADAAAAGGSRSLVDRGIDLVVRTLDGIQAIRRPIPVAIAFLISTLCWTLDGTTFWLAARAVGVDLSIQQAVLVAVVAVLATAIPSAPGYIGTFELAASTAAVAVGVPSAQAVALAVLAHLVTTLPVAIVGANALAASGGSLTSFARRAATSGEAAR